ncbi:polysaccharide pyruvyl transferase family protein [Neiella marina]|uniref:Polysaccharide pyruvyl transferase family protein n=1 Tax=Neiella holothuriorum TaxID=2870530 RepID=A0ABS7EE16_9GAMM|nr:polysaccharide pyruvyl transferase family protein [Neiella holothuriorum]MBW8190572.1 polysaccharide pyruvyl transferase family protein [Neiella holothuriorum]
MDTRTQIRSWLGWAIFLVGYFFLKVLSFGKTKAEYQILIAPPGGGNIGDQAMVESFLENTTKPTVLVVTRKADIELPAHVQSSFRMVELKGLIYGNVVHYIVSFTRFIGLLSKAESVSVVGADIMDGAYNPVASAARANAVFFASKFGCKAKVLGFSWNGAPSDIAKNALLQASNQGAELCLRDPLSAKRAREDNLANVVEVADLVFESTGAVETDELLAVKDKVSEQNLAGYVLVNASGLISKKGLDVAEWHALGELLKKQNLLAVIIPHVSRPGGDDIPPCKELYNYFFHLGVQVYLIERLFAPKEVRGITKEAKLVVTGRMHLAIMSLWNAVPAITLATQGKVDGLKQMFDIKEYSIAPEAGFGSQVASKATEVLADQVALVDKLTLRLAEVKARAKLNFSGL